MTRVVPARRVTAEAARRLRGARSGHVHSAFAHTVNVRLRGLGDAGWVSLHAVHGANPIPSPFGLACLGALDAPGLGRASVRIGRDTVELGALRVSFADATVVETGLPDAAPAPAIRGCLRLALSAPGGSLLTAAAAVLVDAALPGDALASLAGPALASLAAATARGSPAGCVGAARPLLGLGPGLTPAGDDCVAGWVAGAWTAGPGGRALVEAVRPALIEAAHARTGPLSIAFLAAALAGVVAEPVRRFVAHPAGEELAALLALGATSGADFLAGYLLARAALSPEGWTRAAARVG